MSLTVEIEIRTAPPMNAPINITAVVMPDASVRVMKAHMYNEIPVLHIIQACGVELVEAAVYNNVASNEGFKGYVDTMLLPYFEFKSQVDQQRWLINDIKEWLASDHYKKYINDIA